MLLPVLGFLLACPARADTVFLRNGNTMEGSIVSENRGELELDIGYGTVALKRSEIRRIVRSKGRGAELERREFESGRRVPASARRLHELFQEASSARERALEAKDRAKGGEEEGDRTLEKDAAKGLQDYYAAYKSFQEGLDGAAPAKAAGWEAGYYAWIRREAKKMSSDFQKDVVSSVDPGGHVMVQAILNGRVPAKLLVDTGASVSILYPSASADLEIAPEDEVGTTKIYVGDGRAVDARLIRLKSIAVGKSYAKDTVVALVPTPAPGIDGLLGMSFLKNFVVRVDSANGKLILEALK